MTNTATHTQTRIEYSKYFLSGNLEGLSVRCNFTVPAESAAGRMESLQSITKLNPSKDYGTSGEYYAYNVGCVWLNSEVAR